MLRSEPKVEKSLSYDKNLYMNLSSRENNQKNYLKGGLNYKDLM